MEYLIRPARPDDAEGISRVVVTTLCETNAKDYSEEVIARVKQGFSPSAVSDLLAQRLVFVAVNDDVVIGTASLDGRVVRTVFIEPGWQARGIGRALMIEVERAAIERGVVTLAVPSSVTAEPFYAKLGFISIRDSFYGEERTIIMERPLLAVENATRGAHP
ncbi:putative N-acetyltransferase YafP [Methylobacterium bullatum]|uniref:N-acetyltransferase YafP n=1 Tax=Methylobacterium bullatum TaxID=570505 RepID=A0AAV4ZDE2_9HYPH|nr:GNAT family N-acetyltransferase [Methylobacterium bullatum]GJD41962.1 putative N-acetyltransferase YafP [Methylobacterium bullatum]